MSEAPAVEGRLSDKRTNHIRYVHAHRTRPPPPHPWHYRRKRAHAVAIASGEPGKRAPGLGAGGGGVVAGSLVGAGVVTPSGSGDLTAAVGMTLE